MAGTELATAYIALIPSASGIASGISKEMGAPLEAAALSAGKKAGIAAALGITTAIAGFVGLEKIGSSFDAASDKIRIATGATGVVLDGLNQSFKNVVSSVPVDFGVASTAIATLNQKLGLTGKPLEALSTQILNLSRLTGTDLASNVGAVTDLFNSWGTAVADQGPKLDELFRISQKSGISVGDLAAQMASGGVQFRQAGLSFESAGALIGLLAKNGLSAADVLPALSRSMATAAKHGKDAKTAFQGTFDAIKNAPNDTKAAGIALDVFGAKAGPKFAALIREGKLSYQDFATAISAGGDTINAAAKATDDWQEKLKVLVNQGLVALAPIAAKVFDGLTKALTFTADWVKAHWPQIKPVLMDVFDAIKAAVLFVAEQVLPRIVAAFSFVVDWVVARWPRVKEIVVGVFDAIAGWFKANWPAIKTVILDVFDAVKAVVLFVVENVVPKLIAAFESIKGWVQSHWPEIKKVIVGVFDAIKLSVQFLVDHVLAPLASAFQAAFKWLSDNKEFVIGIFAAIGVAVAGMFAVWVAGAAVAAVETVIAFAPVFLVGAAIAAVVGGVIYAYNHFKTFRDVIQKVGDIAQWLWRNVLSPLADFLIVVFKVNFEVVKTAIQIQVVAIQALIDVAMWLWRNVLSPLADFLIAVFKVAWEAIRIQFDIVSTAVSALITVATWLWNNVLSPFVDFLVGVFQVAWLGLTTYFDLASTAVGWVAKYVKGLWQDWMVPFINFITATFNVAIGAVRTAFDFVSAAIGAVANFLKGLWQDWMVPFIHWLGDTFGPVWDNIWGAAKRVVDAVVTAVQTIIDKVKEALGLLASLNPFGGGINVKNLIPGAGGTTGAGGGVSPAPAPSVGSGFTGTPLPGKPSITSFQPFSGNGAPLSMSGPATIWIQGTPFDGIIAKHDNAQAAKLMAGAW